MTKKILLFSFVLIATAALVFAQTSQRRKGPLAEKVQETRQKRKGDQGKPGTGGTGSYVVGKNRFTTVVNGDTREYFVHVPQKYNKSNAVPVVLMLHGTAQSGEQFYNISGWTEVGETENLITVFPTAMVQCIIDEGKQQNVTKWSSYTEGFTFCTGVTPKDDLKFLNQVIDEIEGRFNVEKHQIYVVGFSNGSSMSARLGIEYSERLAAFVGHLGVTPPVLPKRLIPNLWQEGTDDPHYTPMFDGKSMPMDFNQILAKPFMKSALNIYMKTFKLDPKYTTGGNPNNVIWLDAKGTSGDPNNVFRLAIVKGLAHEYPNGKNHPLKGAELNWKWLKQFKLP